MVHKKILAPTCVWDPSGSFILPEAVELSWAVTHPHATGTSVTKEYNKTTYVLKIGMTVITILPQFIPILKGQTLFPLPGYPFNTKQSSTRPPVLFLQQEQTLVLGATHRINWQVNICNGRLRLALKLSQTPRVKSPNFKTIIHEKKTTVIFIQWTNDVQCCTWLLYFLLWTVTVLHDICAKKAL